MRDQDDQRSRLTEGLPCMDEGTERRAMCQVLEFWLGKVGPGRPLPAAHDINPEALPELSPHLFLIDLTRNPERCTIVSSGAVVNAFCGRDVTGAYACDTFPATLGEQVPHLCQAARSYGKPVPHSGTAYAAPGEVIFRIILLPLTGDDGSVDHILGSLTFRPTT